MAWRSRADAVFVEAGRPAVILRTNAAASTAIYEVQDTPAGLQLGLLEEGREPPQKLQELVLTNGQWAIEMQDMATSLQTVIEQRGISLGY